MIEDAILQFRLNIKSVKYRRNTIVHEADIDVAGRIGQKNLIYKEAILENVLFLETVCEKIYEMAAALVI